MAGRIEAVESRLGLSPEAAPERKQEKIREDWERRILKEVLSHPLKLPQQEIEGLRPKTGRGLPHKERERRFLKSAKKVCQVAYHFLPEVLKEKAVCPESGLCQRAEEAIKDLPVFLKVTDENLPLWEILGLPAKLRRKKTFKENDLGFFPPIIQGFLKAVSLEWEMKKRGSEKELLAKETKTAEELGIWFLASKLVLETGSISPVARFLEQKIGNLREKEKAILYQVKSIWRPKPILPQAIEKFSQNKSFPLPASGWDKSLALAEALAISRSFEPPQGRFGISFKLSRGNPGRKILVNKEIFPAKTILEREEVFISFASLGWLAFLFSRPGKFSAAIDFNPAQKLCFIETAFLLLGHQVQPEILGCTFEKSSKKAKLSQEAVEAATSLDFPLTLTISKNKGHLRIPWGKFQDFVEREKSPLNWYQLPDAERYFLLMTLSFHLSNPSLKDLKQQLGFSKKQWERMKHWRERVAIAKFLYPYFASFYGSFPRKGSTSEERKEAISFMAQIFFRRGEKVIWELKRRFPQTPLPDLARLFVSVDRNFCDLTKISIEEIVNWRDSLQPAMNDWQWILEQGWSLRPNLEAIEELKKEEIDSERLLNQLWQMGIPKGILEHLKNIAQEGPNQKIINGWISCFIERKGGKKKISKVELILFGLALARRATLFSQAVMEYKLLAILGKVPNSTYRKIGFSQRQLADELFEKAARRTQEAKALAILAQMVASKRGLRGDVFLEIDEKLEKINYREKGYLPPEFYPLPLKFMAGREVYLVEGCLSFHRLGEGISTYRNHQWQPEDEEPFF